MEGLLVGLPHYTVRNRGAESRHGFQELSLSRRCRPGSSPVQPGPGDRPTAVGRPRRDAELPRRSRGGAVRRRSGAGPVRPPGPARAQLGQRFVQASRSSGTSGAGDLDPVEVLAPGRRRACGSACGGRCRPGCGAWPRRRRRRSGRGRSRLRRLLTPTRRTYASWTRAVGCSVWPGFSWASSCGRQLAQLVVDQGQQLLGGLRVALLDGGQDARDVGHAA